MEMDCLTFTEAEVVADGTVALGFVDETGKSVKVRLSLNQVGRLAMTLPELVATALRNQHGNQKMRFAYPLTQSFMPWPRGMGLENAALSRRSAKAGSNLSLTTKQIIVATGFLGLRRHRKWPVTTSPLWGALGVPKTSSIKCVFMRDRRRSSCRSLGAQLLCPRRP
jgi:hypothetical protein